jgi:hypothetical protein
MAAALTPKILANIGPTVSEISLCSLKRPLLSLLLDTDALATFQFRVLPYRIRVTLPTSHAAQRQTRSCMPQGGINLWYPKYKTDGVILLTGALPPCLRRWQGATLLG